MFTAIDTPLQAFEPLFAQRALLAVLALAVLSMAVGPMIVLRELPFFAHAVGGGSYPVLVLAAGIGAPLALMAPLGALLFAAVLWAVSGAGERAGRNRDAETALLVASAYALGAVLAATAFAGSFGVGLSPESLLFGSVLTAGGETIAQAWAVCAVCTAGAWLLGHRWLALGFDPVAPRAKAWRLHEALLLATIALAVAATLPLAGALMGAALLVVPAATARVLTDNRAHLTQLTLALALTEGVSGLYLALVLDLPPGAMIATIAGATFAVAAVAVVAGRRGSRAFGPIAAAVLLALMAVSVAGCGSNGGDGDGETPVVVATTTQVGDLARQVGGDGVRVKALLAPGVDPHEYEPSPSDVSALAKADVILYSGGDLDTWLVSALKSSGNGKTPVDVSQSVALIDNAGAGDPGSFASGAAGSTQAAGSADRSFNPHWYLSPANLVAATARVRTELAKARPAARETFRANADRYAGQVDAVAAGLMDCAATMPAEGRAVVTEHNDFAYLTEFLGVPVAAQLRSSGTSAASARAADDALRKARRAGANAVLVSKGEGGALPSTVADRLNVPLLELQADTLAGSGVTSTSLGAIADNTRQIVKALGGDPGSCPRVAN